MSRNRSNRTIFYLLVLCVILLLTCFGLLETSLVAQVFAP